MTRPCGTPRSMAGFTLVELLVALFVLSIMAVLRWRGLEGMSRAQEQTQSRAQEVLALQIGLSQWTADLDAVTQFPGATAIEWNGRVMRMTRRNSVSATGGALVVGWTRRIVDGSGTWLRWQSPVLTTRAELDDAWRKADAWAREQGTEERQREVQISGLDEWQIFFYRGNAWTNPLSSDVTSPSAAAPPQGAASGAAAPAPGAAPGASVATAVIPDGVRLVLTLPPGQAVTGRLTIDWIRPTWGGGKG